MRWTETARRLPCRRLGIFTTLALLIGCGIDTGYLLPAAAGQLYILVHMTPVEKAIAEGKLTDAQIEKLELIQDVRDFASDVVGLNAGDNYTTFYDAGDQPVAFNVSASRKDAFEPKIWSFPLVGDVPYLGFFDEELALERRDDLEADGYDVFIYQIDAYSGLGFYANPILSPMLDRPAANLIDTVIHELLHSTIWRPNDTSFNESLATFVGRTGAVQYIAEKWADEPERVEAALARFEDVDRYNAFMLSLYEELANYYASDLDSEAKIAGRGTVFQTGRDRFMAEVLPLMNVPENYTWVENLPENNAFMLGVRRYNLDLQAFQRVFDAANQDWGEAMTAYRQAAQADDPYAFLDGWPASARGSARVLTRGGAPVDEDPKRGNSLPAPGVPRLCPACRATTWVPQE